MIDPLRMLDFRGRPYTRALPFAHVFTGVAGELAHLWQPKNAFFELALILMKGTVAAEYTVCDTNSANIIGFCQVDGVNFSRLDLGLAGIRSNRLANAELLILDGVGLAATIHGVIYGWEVTPEGNYR